MTRYISVALCSFIITLCVCVCVCVCVQGLLELQKAQRCARQTVGWDREWSGIERAAQLTLKYCHSQFMSNTL